MPATTLEPCPGVQRHRRLLCSLDVEVVSGSISERMTCQDLSASGMFLDSRQGYLAGMLVTLRFRLDDHDFETRAEVVHVQPQIGFGVRFLSLPRDATARILRYVHRERATREAEQLLADRLCP